MNYISLYLQTEYSFLTSLITVDKLIEKALEKRMKTLAISDVNMFGVMEFYEKCIKNNIKPIIGLELNVDGIIIILYAKNYEGYQELCSLSTKQSEGQVTFEDLNNALNLICILPFKYIEKYSLINEKISETFIGYSNKEENDKLKNHKNKLYNPKINTLLDNKEKIIEYLQKIKTNSLISYKDLSSRSYLSDKEISEIPKIDLENIKYITDNCNVKIIKQSDLFPKFIIKGADNDQYLYKLCYKGLKKRLNNNIPENYMQRLNLELEVISSMGYVDYFLIVWDYVKYAKRNDILCSARGSAVSSMVSYTLGITDVDPLKYNLLFERFLNPERITMPDIDIDFDSVKRDVVFKYVTEKYGMKNCAKIITFSHFTAKQVVRDLANVFDISDFKIDFLVKNFDENKTLSELLNKQAIKDILLKDKSINQMYKAAMDIEGLKRHFSVHAAGIIISNENLDNYIPLVKYDENNYLTGYSMDYLEKMGLLKMDFLGLKTFNIIDKIIKRINDKEVNFNLIPLNDEKVFNIFEKGISEGIFQFETPGMRDFLIELKPKNIDDLVAAVALYRPGPMDNIPSYIKRRNNKEKIIYIHIDLKKILEPTYGIIIYQEQIMQIARKFAGYSLGEADILRRAISKKKLNMLKNEETNFINSSYNKGYLKNTAKGIYDLILKFANYGFPKAHSVPYAIIGYKMAYLKTYFSKEYMCELLTNSLGAVNKTQKYINECKKLDVVVKKPDINKSSYEYVIENNSIYYSLAMIKKVGMNLAKEIILERNHNSFLNYFDFIRRMQEKINVNSINNLVLAGCFDCFGYNKKTLIENMDTAINYGQLTGKDSKVMIPIPKMKVFDEYADDFLLESQIDVFGFYLSNHPVSKYKTQKDIINTKNIGNYYDKVIDIILYLSNPKEINTKNNEKMMFATGEDEEGTLDLTIFPRTYKKFFNIKLPSVYKVTARVEKRVSKIYLNVISFDKKI